jgi:hypothetical protein
VAGGSVIPFISSGNEGRINPFIVQKMMKPFGAHRTRRIKAWPFISRGDHNVQAA